MRGGGCYDYASTYSFRFSCFIGACLLYGVLGSPTPNVPGVTEVLIGALLVLAVGLEGAVFVFRSLRASRAFFSGAVFLFYGLSVPLIIAVSSGHSAVQILRDLAPFIFLFCPLFFLPLFRYQRRRVDVAVCCLLFIGAMFSLRSLAGQSGVCVLFCQGELLYLENMPTVLFAGLFLIGGAMYVFMRGDRTGGLLKSLLVVCFALPPFFAMALTLQRASLGAFALYILIILCFYLYYRPMRATWLFVFVVALFTVFSTVLSVSFLPVADIFGKTGLVGLNNRPQEADAVWRAVSENPASLFFGLGWGAHFNSPAVGGLSVNFTHNFFTTMLLKTGLCGLILSLAYIAGTARVLGRVVLCSPVIGLALAAPFLIDITLYASFKSLDFGLTLLMINLSLVYCVSSESSFQKFKSIHASSDHTLHKPGLSSCTRGNGAGVA